MREIKFIAWDKRYKKMIEPISLESMVSKLANPLFNWTMRDIINTRPNDLTWRQYTGLKDKNWVEIYEGDVFDCIYNNHCACKKVISWQEERCMFMPLWHIRCVQSWVTQTMYDMTRHSIIWNIYQNPNLIK